MARSPRAQHPAPARRALVAVEEVGHGEALVMIHGVATTRGIWSAVGPHLSRTRRVVTLDVPGFGESTPVGQGFDLERVAARIARGLSARGIRAPFDLVGHSLGAGIALTLAAARPRLVRRLVLVAPAGLTSVPWPAPVVLPPVADGLLAVRRRLAPLAELGLGRRMLLGFTVADGALLAPTQARKMIEASAGAQRTSAALAAITRTNLRPLLGLTPAALGLIWGAEDRTVSARGVAVVRHERPDAEVAIIQHAGHVPMVERPEAFVAALERLLARLPKDATTRRHRPTTVS